jgi:hypothetical protein
VLGQQELGLAPSGRGPFRGDDKDDKLAMIDGCLQCCLPAIAGDQPTFRVEIKEDIVPALRFHPVANRDGFRIVGTRMTDKNARHGLCTPYSEIRLSGTPKPAITRSFC